MKINQIPEVDPGSYPGKLVAVAETIHEQYGPGLRWDFELDIGGIVSRTTKPDASNSNTCGAFCQMVSGLPLDEAIQSDTEDWVGVCGEILVENSPSGNGVRVARFTRAPEQPRNPADTSF